MPYKERIEVANIGPIIHANGIFKKSAICYLPTLDPSFAPKNVTIGHQIVTFFGAILITFFNALLFLSLGFGFGLRNVTNYYKIVTCF